MLRIGYFVMTQQTVIETDATLTADRTGNSSIFSCNVDERLLATVNGLWRGFIQCIQANIVI